VTSPASKLSGRVIARGLDYPEGPIAMPDGSLIFVEIAGGRLSRVDENGKLSVVAEVGGGPNGAALGPDGRIYLANNGGVKWRRDGDRVRPIGKEQDPGRIEVVDPETGKFELLYARCGDREFRHCNDLVFGADGSFWFTDTGRAGGRTTENGSVFWAKADGSEIREAAYPLVAPNGIGLSPDGRTLYVSETYTARLWAWEISGPGKLAKAASSPMAHGGRFVCGSAAFAMYDSLAVSASGKILVATLMNGGITEAAPDGGGTRHLALPTPHVNNICFGGPDLKTAYITLSGDGEIIALDWHEPGQRLNFQL
jgi:gluconolactonase